MPSGPPDRQADVLVAEMVPDDICAAEPIHLVASIQPHGALVGLSCEATPQVLWTSANYAAYFGADVLERPAASLLGAGYIEGLQQRHDAGDLSGELPWETTISLPGTPGSQLKAAGHVQNGLLIVELEPLLATDAADALVAGRRLQRCVARLRAAETGLEALAQVAAEGVRALTGYERVLVYRFDTDWHGMAIAETKTADWEQSLNKLHFPAADIPAQARALYRRSLMRWVPARDATPVPILRSPRAAPSEIIDLSFARLRSLSSVHMQYHRNMGVDGSMSLSILNHGELWGLMVCHHRRPHRLSPGQRSAAASLVDAFALRIEAAERTSTRQQRRADAQRMADLLSHAVEAEDVERAVTGGSVTIAHLFNATGAASVQGGSIVSLGVTPPASDMLALVGWLRGRPETEVYATDRLPEHYPPFARHGAIASGLLAVFLSSDRADMLLWLRPEEPQQVSWGGDPRKPDAQAQILPRQSFERWVETRHGQATPWAEWELEMAASLRHSISEVMVRHLRRLASLNEQLRQAQKMEAVGQLTGGLAHDFNNLLTGITGSLEMMQTRLDQDRPKDVSRYIGIALGAASRAAALTHRLLAFARRQTLDPQLLDVNGLIVGLEDLIRQTVGSNIQLRTVLAERLWPTLCDPNQLENALLNLCINARDAMPEGGSLTIETANAALGDRRAAAMDDLPPGQYVSLRVSDSGTGMSPDVIARAFDPFFTTKPYGAGSGLGLSMIYGFAKQSGGNVRIYSQAGHGSTIKLYLPCDVARPDPETAQTPAILPHGLQSGTVLVVDDEPGLLMLVTEMLSDLGYTVVSTGSATEALEILGDTQIDLLVTDAGLSGDVGGQDLGTAARLLRADLKVLFITGYAETAVFGDRIQHEWERILSKPFSLEALASITYGLLHA